MLCALRPSPSMTVRWANPAPSGCQYIGRRGCCRRQRFPVDQPAQRPLAAGRFERQFLAAPFDEGAVRRIHDLWSFCRATDSRSGPGSSRCSRAGSSLRATRSAPGGGGESLPRRGRAEKVGELEEDRSRGQPAAAPRHRGAVGPSRPHADRDLGIITDRPEIAVAVGCPGLEREPSPAPDFGRHDAGRRRRLGQDVVDIPCPERPEDRPCRGATGRRAR